MAKVTERVATFVSAIETGKWAWITFQLAPMLASFGVTAWAVWAADLFSQYTPLSWIGAGIVGALVWGVVRVLHAAAWRVRVRARYDARFLEHGASFNPLDLTFERKRIYVNDFVLPSHPTVEGKTFIDCDIIGPANIYFGPTSVAAPIRSPRVDGVWLHPDARFVNGFTFDNCIFRNCSFQRITLFASAENYEGWRNNVNISWIGVPPSPEMVLQRKRTVNEVHRRLGMILLYPDVEPPTLPLIEPPGAKEGKDGPTRP
jgi:hypothetical protein